MELKEEQGEIVGKQVREHKEKEIPGFEKCLQIVHEIVEVI